MQLVEVNDITNFFN